MSAPKLLILASGGGSLFEHLVRQSQQGHLKARVIGLISSKASAPVNRVAARLGVESQPLNPKEFEDRQAWAEALVKAVHDWKPDWIVLAGYTLKLPEDLLVKFPKRIINTHPSLLPKYGGKGMYGKKVHEAVFQAKDKETGVTVHIVTSEYDSGPILGQKQISLHSTDTASNIEEKVKAMERDFYVEVLNKLFLDRPDKKQAMSN